MVSPKKYKLFLKKKNGEIRVKLICKYKTNLHLIASVFNRKYFFEGKKKK